jgi:sulfite exporter TauE/SafE
MESWTKRILAVGKRMQSTSPIQKAFVMGLITTWLPCGWLYLFALASSSTGSVGRATWMMFAFWIGTLPLLSLLAIGSESLRNRNVFSSLAKIPVLGVLFRIPLQAFVAALMIAFGVYTIAFRSQISLDGMISPIHAGELNQASIAALGDEPLPCCKERIDKNNKQVESTAQAIDSAPEPVKTVAPESKESRSQNAEHLNSKSMGGR